jgi:serine/threonine protein kinase/Flp pilus assembly protein TadD
MNSRDSVDLSIEPAVIRLLTPEQKDRLTDLLDGYLCQLEKGLPPPRENLLETNPDLAGPLNAYFDSLDELHDMAAGFERPPIDARCDDSVPAGDERRLGDFRLLREIGRGGMGVVYEAQQISLGRRVALKVLPFAAVLDSRQIARFKHEAQAAAQLNHPNIVSVFAVGVERGVHYYAMQYIDGQPLDRALTELRAKYSIPARQRQTAGSECVAELPGKSVPQSSSLWNSTQPRSPCDGSEATIPACSTHRSLLTSRAAGGSEYFRAVTRLGIQAASALHAAHENGIVHRDIKPSNLLLDGNGKLWVTDFGLARRQTDAALTRTGDVVGTVRYMSPEQALGQVALVDHRTDIYSLAVTLYELLTLEPVFSGDEGPVLIRHIERKEPRPLRQIQPKIPADLQTVVLKGMAKRREDRYATAQEFADDLQRVLEGKPTVARPPSVLDRTARWAQRHREVVTVAGLIGVLALVGLATATLLILREQQNTELNLRLAVKEFQNAQDAVEYLARFSDRLVDIPDADRVRQALLRQTLDYFRGFVEQPNDNPELRTLRALAYSRIGSLSRDLGSIADALDADRHAIQLFQELAAADPRKLDFRRRIGVCQNNLALDLEQSGRIDDARRAYAEAIHLQEEVIDAAEDSGQSLADLAKAHGNLGLLQNETGDVESASASFARAVGLQEQLLRAAPDDPERLRDLAVTLNKLGALHAERQPAKAIEYYEKAAAMQKKAVELRPEESIYRNELALTYNNLGASQSRSGAMAQAVESDAKVVDLATELVRQSPAQKAYRRTLAVGFDHLGLAQSKLGHAAAAEPSFRDALALLETLVKQDPRDVDLQSVIGGVYNNLGIVLEELNRSADAVKAYEQAVAHQQQAMAKAPQITKYRQFLSKHYFNYGRVLRKMGRLGDAAQAALARRELWPKDPQHLFSVAEDLALIARDISAGGKAGASGKITTDKCGAAAVATLKQAAAAGWKPAANSDWTKSFLAIKNRADFLALTKN